MLCVLCLTIWRLKRLFINDLICLHLLKTSLIYTYILYKYLKIFDSDIFWWGTWPCYLLKKSVQKCFHFVVFFALFILKWAKKVIIKCQHKFAQFLAFLPPKRTDLFWWNFVDIFILNCKSVCRVIFMNTLFDDVTTAILCKTSKNTVITIFFCPSIFKFGCRVD